MGCARVARGGHIVTVVLFACALDKQPAALAEPIHRHFASIPTSYKELQATNWRPQLFLLRSSCSTCNAQVRYFLPSQRNKQNAHTPPHNNFTIDHTITGTIPFLITLHPKRHYNQFINFKLLFFLHPWTFHSSKSNWINLEMSNYIFVLQRWNLGLKYCDLGKSFVYKMVEKKK